MKNFNKNKIKALLLILMNKLNKVSNNTGTLLRRVAIGTSLFTASMNFAASSSSGLAATERGSTASTNFLSVRNFLPVSPIDEGILDRSDFQRNLVTAFRGIEGLSKTFEERLNPFLAKLLGNSVVQLQRGRNGKSPEIALFSSGSLILRQYGLSNKSPGFTVDGLFFALLFTGENGSMKFFGNEIRDQELTAFNSRVKAKTDPDKDLTGHPLSPFTLTLDGLLTEAKGLANAAEEAAAKAEVARKVAAEAEAQRLAEERAAAEQEAARLREEAEAEAARKAAEGVETYVSDSGATSSDVPPRVVPGQGGVPDSRPESARSQTPLEDMLNEIGELASNRLSIVDPENRAVLDLIKAEISPQVTTIEEVKQLIIDKFRTQFTSTASIALAVPMEIIEEYIKKEDLEKLKPSLEKLAGEMIETGEGEGEGEAKAKRDELIDDMRKGLAGYKSMFEIFKRAVDKMSIAGIFTSPEIPAEPAPVVAKQQVPAEGEPSVDSSTSFISRPAPVAADEKIIDKIRAGMQRTLLAMPEGEPVTEVMVSRDLSEEILARITTDGKTTEEVLDEVLGKIAELAFPLFGIPDDQKGAVVNFLKGEKAEILRAKQYIPALKTILNKIDITKKTAEEVLGEVLEKMKGPQAEISSHQREFIVNFLEGREAIGPATHFRKLALNQIRLAQLLALKDKKGAEIKELKGLQSSDSAQRKEFRNLIANQARLAQLLALKDPTEDQIEELKDLRSSNNKADRVFEYRTKLDLFKHAVMNGIENRKKRADVKAIENEEERKDAHEKTKAYYQDMIRRMESQLKDQEERIEQRAKELREEDRKKRVEDHEKLAAYYRDMISRMGSRLKDHMPPSLRDLSQDEIKQLLLDPNAFADSKGLSAEERNSPFFQRIVENWAEIPEAGRASRADEVMKASKELEEEWDRLAKSSKPIMDLNFTGAVQGSQIEEWEIIPSIVVAVRIIPHSDLLRILNDVNADSYLRSLVNEIETINESEFNKIMNKLTKAGQFTQRIGLIIGKDIIIGKDKLSVIVDPFMERNGVKKYAPLIALDKKVQEWFAKDKEPEPVKDFRNFLKKHLDGALSGLNETDKHTIAGTHPNKDKDKNTFRGLMEFLTGTDDSFWSTIDQLEMDLQERAGREYLKTITNSTKEIQGKTYKLSDEEKAQLEDPSFMANKVTHVLPMIYDLVVDIMASEREEGEKEERIRLIIAKSILYGFVVDTVRSRSPELEEGGITETAGRYYLYRDDVLKVKNLVNTTEIKKTITEGLKSIESNRQLFDAFSSSVRLLTNKQIVDKLGLAVKIPTTKGARIFGELGLDLPYKQIDIEVVNERIKALLESARKDVKAGVPAMEVIAALSSTKKNLSITKENEEEAFLPLPFMQAYGDILAVRNKLLAQANLDIAKIRLDIAVAKQRNRMIEHWIAVRQKWANIWPDPEHAAFTFNAAKAHFGEDLEINKEQWKASIPGIIVNGGESAGESLKKLSDVTDADRKQWSVIPDALLKAYYAKTGKTEDELFLEYVNKHIDKYNDELDSIGFPRDKLGKLSPEDEHFEGIKEGMKPHYKADFEIELLGKIWKEILGNAQKVEETEGETKIDSDGHDLENTGEMPVIDGPAQFSEDEDSKFYRERMGDTTALDGQTDDYATDEDGSYEKMFDLFKPDTNIKPGYETLIVTKEHSPAITNEHFKGNKADLNVGVTKSKQAKLTEITYPGVDEEARAQRQAAEKEAQRQALATSAIEAIQESGIALPPEAHETVAKVAETVANLSRDEDNNEMKEAIVAIITANLDATSAGFPLLAELVMEAHQTEQTVMGAHRKAETVRTILDSAVDALNVNKAFREGNQLVKGFLEDNQPGLAILASTPDQEGERIEGALMTLSKEQHAALEPLVVIPQTREDLLTIAKAEEGVVTATLKALSTADTKHQDPLLKKIAGFVEGDQALTEGDVDMVRECQEYMELKQFDGDISIENFRLLFEKTVKPVSMRIHEVDLKLAEKLLTDPDLNTKLTSMDKEVVFALLEWTEVDQLNGYRMKALQRKDEEAVNLAFSDFKNVIKILDYVKNNGFAGRSYQELFADLKNFAPRYSTDLSTNVNMELFMDSLNYKYHGNILA